jgi:hypothetical protein
MHHIAPARRRRARTTLLAAALPAVLAAAALPAAAEASAVGVDTTNRTLLVIDNRGEANDLSVVPVGGALRVTDSKPLARLFLNDECVSLTPTSASCSPARVSRIQVQLGTGDDAYTSAVSLPTAVFGSSGADTYNGAITTGSSQVDFVGGEGFDTVNYGLADAGVSITKDTSFNDGRSGRDNDRIGADVERVFGSRFADTLVGSSAPVEHFEGGAGDDTLQGGGGNDVFRTGSAADGADDLFGGDGEDSVEYTLRTRPVTATLSDGGDDDGEAGERDEIRQVERVRGGSAGDTLSVHPDSTTPASLLGMAGSDTLTGPRRGATTFNGGTGQDTMTGGAGADVFQARDGEQDTVGCGEGVDTALVDSGRDLFGGCERFEQVGVLRLAPRAVQAEADGPARVALSWRHPRGWRQLDRVVLRVLQDDVPVGEVVMKPRGRRMTAEGALRVVRRASRLGTRGKAATARLALRVDPSLAGERLRLEVEATDVRGRRQLETRAGTLRIAD